ncbi:MAG: 2,3-bisphosphoglycerate-independent phosphoglycerate mutase [Chloroflexota bacterium]
MASPRLVTLVVLDGFGYTTRVEGNAIRAARTPVYDRLWGGFPHTLLQASGEAVGLPDGQMGNSEVGHMHLGAGRTLYQKLTLISRSIRDGSFFRKEAFLDALAHVKRRGSQLHLIGLLGPGGVHALSEHLYALLRLAREQEVERVAIHVITDGRDTPPESAAEYLIALEEQIASIGVGRVASVSGRYYAMDRDNRWERTALAYAALAGGEGPRAVSPRAAILSSDDAGVADEFIVPTVIADDAGPVATVADHDAVIFFNFRSDRPRQLTRAFVDPAFDRFPRGHLLTDLMFVTMAHYEAGLPVRVAFTPEDLTTEEVSLPLAGVLAERGLAQLHAAETEKYAHVTYFINGGREEPFPGEERILIPSPKVPTYDRQPEMSAREIATSVADAIARTEVGFTVVNFANCDMVGHTGIMAAAVTAVETVDACLSRILAATERREGVLLLTADHGNCEQMIDYTTGQPHTAHTTNPVPFILVAPSRYTALHSAQLRTGGTLADVAPTVLDILGLEQPPSMTGRTLLVKG